MNHIAGPQKVYQALQGNIPFSSPEFVESIETLKEMMQKGYWMGGVDRFFTTTFEEFSTAFASGEAAMNLEGSWFPGRAGGLFDDAGQEYDWVPVPSKSGESIYSIGIGGVRAINKNAKYPDAAAEWLTHEFSPEVQSRLFVDCGVSPAPVNLDAAMLNGADPRLARLFADFSKAQAADNYGYTTYTFWSPNSETYLYDEIQKVLTNDLSVEDYLKGLDEAFSEDLKAGLRPPLPQRS
jgi:raffinose/stachyose/melibiose transport system substrate-binding protein